MATHVGFAGGTTAAPSYQEVCAGDTGHAEVVKVTYDLRLLSTRKLLTFFFNLHDFEKDRRLVKRGQYRSAIFSVGGSPREKESLAEARTLLRLLREKGFAPVTEVATVAAFYPASGRHQQYCEVKNLPPRAFKGKLTLP